MALNRRDATKSRGNLRAANDVRSVDSRVIGSNPNKTNYGGSKFLVKDIIAAG